jgi:hypothetical protein
MGDRSLALGETGSRSVQDRLAASGSFALLSYDETLAESSSPDGRYTARAVLRNCGATTDYSRLVTLADRRGGTGTSLDTVYIIRGEGPVAFEWVSRDRLKVGASTAKIYVASEAWRDVHIEYARIDPAHVQGAEGR